MRYILTIIAILSSYTMALGEQLPGRIEAQLEKLRKEKTWITPDNRLRYDQTCFLTAHSAYDNPKEGFKISYQQEMSVPGQLDSGARGLMLGTHYYRDNVYLCHGPCAGVQSLSQKTVGETIKGAFGVPGEYFLFKDTMTNIKKWLDNHPKEIVTVFLQNYAPTKKIKEVLNSIPGMSSMLLTRHDWNPADHDGYWPTLQWLQQRNKRLIMFDSKETDEATGIYYQWFYIVENQYSQISIDKAARQRDSSKESPDAALRQLKESEARLDLAKRAYNKDQTASNQKAVEIFTKQVELREKQVRNVNNRRLYLLNLFGNPTIYDSRNINSSGNLRKLIQTCKERNVSSLNPNFFALDFIHQGDPLVLINQLNQQALVRLLRKPMSQLHP